MGELVWEARLGPPRGPGWMPLPAAAPNSLSFIGRDIAATSQVWLTRLLAPLPLQIQILSH